MRKWLIGFATICVIAVAAIRFAPYLYVESWPLLHKSQPVSPDAPKLSKGRMFDDYFAIQDLGGGVFAIGEPRYYQANYAYLIIGGTRALLFDAGSGTRDMSPVIGSLTRLPVVVVPSHFHYDHYAGLTAFDHIGLVDLPVTRADAHHGRVRPGRYQFLGMFDGLAAPSVKVGQWIRPGATIDLGGRALTLIATPGHTGESVALFDRKARRLFTGDFIYPTMLYGFLPGASLADYRVTAKHLLTALPPDTILWTAHCCRRDEGYAAPWLTMTDLRDLDGALSRLEAGELRFTGFFPRRYPVNRQMDIGTGFSWPGH